MLSKEGINKIFKTARSFNGWEETPVSKEQITEIYEIMKFGPTAANSCPARILFVTSEEAKANLSKHMFEGNKKKAMDAPVVAIISYDTEFYEKLPFLFPHTDAKSWYEGNATKIENDGKMNATLQGAYFMIAARSVGLDCGPMGGFNKKKLDAEFFKDGKNKSIFVCCLGYGKQDSIFERSPRLCFDEACTII
jgi:3-hydroxypropanoate dehydrogenase